VHHIRRLIGIGQLLPGFQLSAYLVVQVFVVNRYQGITGAVFFNPSSNIRTFSALSSWRRKLRGGAAQRATQRSTRSSRAGLCPSFAPEWEKYLRDQSILEIHHEDFFVCRLRYGSFYTPHTK